MIEERPSQAVCIDHLAHTDTLIERFEQWARAPGQKFLADKSSARRRRSERTLARLSHQVPGKTPLSYFEDLRIEHAVHRLQTGKASVDATASERWDMT